MLDAEELAVHIARLEYEPSSFENYQKLAALYVIRDHLQGKPPELPTSDFGGYSYAAPPPQETTAQPDIIRTDGGSPFLEAVNGKPSRRVLDVLEELMETLAMVNERAYNRVMEQIEQL